MRVLATRTDEGQRDWGHTPALELAIGEQGAGVGKSACDRGRSQARAQRDSGKELAHLAIIVVQEATTGHAVATTVGVAETQLAVAVQPCSHRRQDKQSGLAGQQTRGSRRSKPPAKNLLLHLNHQKTQSRRGTLPRLYPLKKTCAVQYSTGSRASSRVRVMAPPNPGITPSVRIASSSLYLACQAMELLTPWPRPSTSRSSTQFRQQAGTHLPLLTDILETKNDVLRGRLSTPPRTPLNANDCG